MRQYINSKGGREYSGNTSKGFALREVLGADDTQVSNVIVTAKAMTYRCGGHRLHMEGRQGRQTAVPERFETIQTAK